MLLNRAYISFQTEPPSATSPNMLIKGTTEPIRVASTDMTAASGTFRAQTADGGLGGAVSTDTVTSFAYLPDLLDMPLEVIISLEELTFMTVDGFMVRATHERMSFAQHNVWSGSERISMASCSRMREPPCSHLRVPPCSRGPHICIAHMCMAHM